MFTPESLLQLATDNEARYKALLVEFPPGTYNQERNETYDAMEQAMVCAAWMEREGIEELPYVGPFGTLPFSRGSRVRVRKGAMVYGTGGLGDGAAAKTSHVVTVHSIDKGLCLARGAQP